MRTVRPSLRRAPSIVSASAADRGRERRDPDAVEVDVVPGITCRCPYTRCNRDERDQRRHKSARQRYGTTCLVVLRRMPRTIGPVSESTHPSDGGCSERLQATLGSTNSQMRPISSKPSFRVQLLRPVVAVGDQEREVVAGLPVRPPRARVTVARARPRLRNRSRVNTSSIWPIFRLVVELAVAPDLAVDARPRRSACRPLRPSHAGSRRAAGRPRRPGRAGRSASRRPDRHELVDRHLVHDRRVDVAIGIRAARP